MHSSADDGRPPSQASAVVTVSLAVMNRSCENHIKYRRVHVPLSISYCCRGRSKSDLPGNLGGELRCAIVLRRCPSMIVFVRWAKSGSESTTSRHGATPASPPTAKKPPPTDPADRTDVSSVGVEQAIAASILIRPSRSDHPVEHSAVIGRLIGSGCGIRRRGGRRLGGRRRRTRRGFRSW